jgi:hypothetical protein
MLFQYFNRSSEKKYGVHAGLFLSFRTFLNGQQSKLTEKLKNSALNLFRMVNEPKEQEISRFWNLVGT